MAVGRNGDNSGVAVGLLYLSLLLSQRVCIVLVEGVGPGIGLGHFFRRVHGGLGGVRLKCTEVGAIFRDLFLKGAFSVVEYIKFIKIYLKLVNIN